MPKNLNMKVNWKKYVLKIDMRMEYIFLSIDKYAPRFSNLRTLGEQCPSTSTLKREYNKNSGIQGQSYLVGYVSDPKSLR